MSREQLKALFICSHQWTKEIVGRYRDINYNAQLILCMKELMRQKRNGEHNLF